MRTLLLGLDGATYDLLDPFMKQGIMPFLRDFTDRGTRASMMSTPNPVTPPAWTSMMTGRSPGHHGIFDFIRAEESVEGQIGYRFVNAQDVICETLCTSTAAAALARARLRPVVGSRRSAVAVTTLPVTACGSTCTTKVRCPLAPAAIAPTFHCTTPLLSTPPSEADTRLVPAGSGTAKTAAAEPVPPGLPKCSV